MLSAVEEEGVGAADEPEEAEGEEVEEDEGNEEDEESSEDSSSSEESGAEDEGADDEGPEDEEEGVEGVAALPISKEQQEAEEEDLGKVCSLNFLNEISSSIFNSCLSLLEIDFVSHRCRYSVARELYCCLVIQSEHDVLIDI